MLLYNAELFAGIPQLRATFFLKVFPRHAESRRFKALALLFRRIDEGVTCVDAVSCGTAPLGQQIGFLALGFVGVVRLGVEAQRQPQRQCW